MEAGNVLPFTAWRQWYKRLWTFVGVIERETTMLISSNNNIGMISGNYPDWHKKLETSGMIIMDEAGFEQEWRAMVPIACSHQHLSLVGDHDQLQPIVVQRGPFAGQASLSLFERCVEHMDVESVTLRCTYRLRKYISDFPGNIKYNGLLTLQSEEFHKSQV